MEEIIKVTDLRKSFDGVQILKGITFSLHKGKVLGIIGPSGSGKSTVLRCVSQLESVDGGTIEICGKTLVDGGVYCSKSEAREIGLKTGLVFQNFNLFPHMSVIENVTDAPIHVLKKTKEEAFSEARELLVRMNLSDRADYYPCQLSGGQQQRVSIARALALNPEVLFFDEPTSALDPELTGEILSVIRDLASSKMTMVIVTHEMSFARDTSDYVFFMDNGKIVEEGKPEDVISNPTQERTKLFLSRFSK
ncbi:MAG: amino acid ABC transporter ATP-binding protein [Treponema sp.]